MFARNLSKLLAAVAVIAVPSPVTYADTPAPAPAAPVVVPPALVKFVPAPYPDGVEPRDEEVAIELELIVGADGTVSDAKVIAGAGDAFDTAALTAARAFVFTPATKDGVAMAARIRYRYIFERPRVASPVPVEEAPVELTEQAPAEQPAEQEDGELREYGATARVEAPATDLTRRRVSAEELTRMAGTRGDALRTIELLPGVARPPSGMGFVIVRGAAPWDSEVSFEGAPVMNLYHFGGLTSFVNGDLVEGIDLYPGNFSVRYGRRIGAIIKADLRDPKTDKLRAVADVNMIDASGLIEGPISKTLSFAAAARRSYIDAWFGSVAGDAVGVVAAPVYWDYQSMLVWKPTAADRVRLLAYGSGDSLRLVVGPDERDAGIRGEIGQRVQTYRLQTDWKRRWSPTVEHEANVTASRFANRANLGPAIGFDVDANELYGRSEVRWTVAPQLRFTTGVDLMFSDVGGTYDGPAFGQGEGDPHTNDPLSSQETISADRRIQLFRPAAYVEAAIRPSKPLEITVGARTDYTSESETTTVDLRSQAKYTIGDTTLKAGVGEFSQPPEYGWAIMQPSLVPSRAIHTGLGVEHKLGERAQLGVEGFYKRLSSLIVDGPSRTMQLNAGVGRIYGVEVAGRLQPGGPVSGFLSYTLSRSERRDGDGEAWRLFDYDQTHILTAAANWNIGRGWIAGGTFRIVSGNPETPVMGSVYDANHDTYTPVYGATNSARNPMFHRLDLRIEKNFHALGAAWSGYLDVQNAYNQRNREGTRYSYDFAKRGDIPGLPVLPSLGLKATF